MPRTHVCTKSQPNIRCRACEDQRRGWPTSHKPKSNFSPHTLPKAFRPFVQAKIINRVAFVIDRSGSMSHLTSTVKSEFANLIQGMIAQQPPDQETRVTIFTFNDHPRMIVSDIPLGMVNTNLAYHADGNTGLRYAVRDAVFELDRQSQANRDEAFMVVVLTDGLENSSYNFTDSDLKYLIQSRQATDRWSFAFQMPPHAGHIPLKWGVHQENIREWELSTRGYVETTAATVQGFGGYYQARAAGKASVQSFYVKTDFSGLKPQDLKDKLVDVTRKYTVPKPVQGETDIKSFVETTLGEPYRVGRAFYQLTKKEKVQAGKELLIKEKDERTVYGGSAIRSMLGFPYGKEATVDPGNHANFDLFVQSTSTNRKLVRGTKVLVEK